VKTRQQNSKFTQLKYSRETGTQPTCQKAGILLCPHSVDTETSGFQHRRPVTVGQTSHAEERVRRRIDTASHKVFLRILDEICNTGKGKDIYRDVDGHLADSFIKTI
jgi:hypothetical protein